MIYLRYKVQTGCDSVLIENSIKCRQAVII